jgi:predicted dienelactone hydrolase
MFKRKGCLISGLLLMVIAVVVAALLFQQVEIAEQPGTQPDSLAYGERGSYPVGIRSLVIEDESPLDITVWYPALNTGEYEMVSAYPYVFKMSGVFSLLGNIEVAELGGQAIREAPFDLSESPYPVVVLSPGFSMGGFTYAWLAEHLASHGFVVVSPEHAEGMDPGMNDFWRSVITRPQDILTVFNYLDDQVKSGGSLEGLLDPQLVAVVGHSYGGYTTLAAAGARIDFDSFKQLCAETTNEQVPGRDLLCNPIVSHEADIVALAGLDPEPPDLWPAWADPRVDAIVPMAGDAYLGTPFVWGAQPTYEHVSSPKKVKIGFQDAEHMIFAGTCHSVFRLVNMIDVALEQICGDPVWDRNDVHNLVKHFATAFLLAELKQNQDAAAVLAPEAIDFQGVDYQADGY